MVDEKHLQSLQNNGVQSPYRLVTHITNTRKSTSKSKGKKVSGKRHCNKSGLKNLKNVRSDIDSAQAAILSKTIAEEEQVMDKKSSPVLVEKYVHVQGLAILFNFRKYASYVMKYLHATVIRAMEVD